MFYNGAICDIYIGKGAGKKLLYDIQNAQKSIKIVSPYVSPSLIKELIKSRKRDLEVVLITSDNIQDFHGRYEKNIIKLIKQNRKINQLAVENREKWKATSKLLTHIGFVLLIILLVIVYYLRDLEVAFGLIPVVILFLITRFYRIKIKNERIYSYWYSQLFPFKVYMSPYESDQSSTFIHSKIYLIDDKIAYLGSLNFTSSGTKYNYESRIRTEDSNAIKEIKDEIYQLLNYSHLPEKNIQNWGRELYNEPIN